MGSAFLCCASHEHGVDQAAPLAQDRQSVVAAQAERRRLQQLDWDRQAREREEVARLYAAFHEAAARHKRWLRRLVLWGRLHDGWAIYLGAGSSVLF